MVCRTIAVETSRRGLALAACVAIAAPADGEPYRPHSDQVVIERLPVATWFSADRERALRERLARNADRTELAAAAARAYLDAARATSDPRYEGYAQGALAPWWDNDEAPVEILLLRASLRERRHDFDGALADLERVLARAPEHGQAWLARASILQVRGEFSASLDACRQLPVAASRLVQAACVAGAEGLLRGGEQSLAQLRAALKDSRHDDVATRAWGEAVRADIAMARGRYDETEAAFRSGLQLDPTSTYLRTGLVDFLIDRGRSAEALALVGNDSRAVELALRRARALPPGNAEALRIRTRLEEVFGAARRRGDPPHLRSEAYFHLFVTREPARALALAQKNFAAQREPFDVRLLLEAALANQEPEAAQPAIDWLREVGVEHVVLNALVDRLQGAAL